MIQENHFLRYLALQHIGYTNMLDIPQVKNFTGLSEEQILDIQKNYGTYLKQFNITRDGIRDHFAETKRIIHSIPLPTE